MTAGDQLPPPQTSRLRKWMIERMDLEESVCSQFWYQILKKLSGLLKHLEQPEFHICQYISRIFIMES